MIDFSFVPGGCAVLDAPGIRELQLTDAAAGVEELFSDLRAIANDCRFRDCSHGTEPGCAVRAAISNGEIDPARLARWDKLVAEGREEAQSESVRRPKEAMPGRGHRKPKKRMKHRSDEPIE